VPSPCTPPTVTSGYLRAKPVPECRQLRPNLHEVTTLNHELLDDSMEFAALVTYRDASRPVLARAELSASTVVVVRSPTAVPNTRDKTHRVLPEVFGCLTWANHRITQTATQDQTNPSDATMTARTVHTRGATSLNSSILMVPIDRPATATSKNTTGLPLRSASASVVSSILHQRSPRECRLVSPPGRQAPC
jgi:hypothetical protein